MKLRFYLVNADDTDISVATASKKDFVAESERQGAVYSLQGFQKAFNQGQINTFRDQLRIFTIEPMDREIIIQEELENKYGVGFDVSIIDGIISISAHSYTALRDAMKETLTSKAFDEVVKLTKKYQATL